MKMIRSKTQAAQYVTASLSNLLWNRISRADVCCVDYYFETPTGVARIAELFWKLLEQTEGLSVRRVNPRGRTPLTLGKPATTIWFANARDLPKSIRRMGWLYRYSGRNIGYWAYELDHMPVVEAVNANLLSEIWVLTEFMASSVRKSTDIPCYVIPPPLLLDNKISAARREYKNLNNFLVVFDAYSSSARKNPMGAIRAFKQVFRNDKTKRLTVRIVRAHGLPDEIMTALMGEESDQIKIVLKTFDNIEEAHNFMRQHDVYISLHRAEGLGINIVEAILMGLPVIATNYGGNVDFCDPFGVDLVKYELVPGTDIQQLYIGDFVWAEPDLEDACRALETLACRRPEDTAARVRMAQEKVRRIFDNGEILQRIRRRLEC